MSTTTRFTGLYPPSLTPLNPDGSVNVANIDPFVKYYADEGIDGVFLNGTSGESMSLTVSERKATVEAWVQASKKYGSKVRVIAHIGTQSIEDTKELARHAEKTGVDAIAVMAPCFFKPKTVHQLVEYLQKVAAEAPNTPLFYYFYPGITGVDFPVYKVLEAASPVIPTLRGAKYTGMDLRDLSKCQRMENGRFDLLNGYDYLLLPAASIGSRGAIGIACNLLVKQFKTILAYGQGGATLQEAQEAQNQIIELFDVIEKFDNIISPFKHLMKHFKGIEFGPVRCPLKNLSQDEAHRMIQEVEKLLL